MAVAAFLVPLTPALGAGSGDDGQAHAGFGRPVGTGLAPSPNVSPPAGYTVRGIDVSHYQGPINWSQVAASGERFAILKATDNTGYVDPTFATNYLGAKNAGLYVGAYHFALPDRSTGAVQADFFLDHARYVRDGRTLPPMLDIEWPYSGSGSPSPCYGLTPAQMVSWIQAFVAEVQRRTGVRPIIYTNPNWWNPCTGSSKAFATLPLAHAAYASQPGQVSAGWSTFTIWQYTSSGTVPGISGNVDRDVFNGSVAGLATLAGRPVDHADNDFDADRRSELTLYRAANGFWNAENAATGVQPIASYPYGGNPSDVPLTGDFDGDGYADMAVYAEGRWNLRSKHRNVDLAVDYPYGGNATDVPLADDFDGDGTDDIAIYRKGTGQWWAKSVSRDVQIYGGSAYGGNPTDTPLVDDYDGDGYADIALYRGSTGQWHVKSLRRGVQLAASYPFGGDPTDIPLTGDFDGDGKADITLYRQGQGQWFAKSISRGVQLYDAHPYGGDPSDLPTTGDYDNDGFTDIALYRPTAGQWHVKSLRRAVQLYASYPYGGPDDRPPAG
ncbi:GH25 family lysozyme [Actinoplanes solisilvae]|uniref:GH25 family lysozyme n=1 Tax=Actinoplanes solisilvae TaxID=2486853 RepID=UPI001F0C265B|nr:GH25 family lysozyme [Actinoplanes solisilvae]